jgi:CheY-like chemotaxis protein
MPDGGSLTITARRERLTSPPPGAVVPMAPGEYAVVEVTDTGTGMDLATQARIFEPFFTTKPPGRGTGLGLASVYGIVRQNHAGLVVRSAIGEGSTFAVYLPRVEGQPDGLTAVPAAGRPGPATATILLVEDEPWLRDIADRVLSREGYRVLVAADAVEARALAAASPVPIDLLLTDVVMPGVSGPRLAAQLLQERPQLLVLFMSGYGGGELAGELRPEERLLRKPFTPFALLEQVRAVLDGRDSATVLRGEVP